MIQRDESRQLPKPMSDLDCIDFYQHARELGKNGNPGGYIITVELHPFVGWEDDGQRGLLPYAEWDWDGIRQWIADNHDEALLAWQREVTETW